ncbi:MAG: hypothetical protein V9F03_05665 [Microthrixaceae bacterium]
MVDPVGGAIIEREDNPGLNSGRGGVSGGRVSGGSVSGGGEFVGGLVE